MAEQGGGSSAVDAGVGGEPGEGRAYLMQFPDGAAESDGRPASDALATEWLLTNGRGAFAMGTVSGVNTRRYHSLLVAATLPPVGRLNTVAAVNEIVHVDGEAFELGGHEFATDDGETVFHPKGYAHLRRFEKSAGGCRWVYEVGRVRVTKQLRLAWRRNAAELRYRVELTGNEGGGQVGIHLHPLLAMCDFHRLRHDDGEAMPVERLADRVLIHAAEAEPLHLLADGGRFVEEPTWWRRFVRRIETARGQDDRGDLLCPGRFEWAFDGMADGAKELVLRFGLDDPQEAFAEADGRADVLRRAVRHVRQQVRDEEDAKTAAALATAGAAFVVSRVVDDHETPTILAGYPWFADWGRDTMIALPGLLLCTGRYDEAADTLLTFARHTRRGLVPNRFDDYGGEPHYNTVDASLWFIHAALEYVRITGDEDAWRGGRHSLGEACAEIIAAYEAGTDGPIGMDDDGLISAGHRETQLTWMDAKQGDVVFTPRHGMAVEINALWHRALVGCATGLAAVDAKRAKRCGELAAKVRESFNALFWSERLGYLVDHVEPGGQVDESLRPNQVFAVSLPDSPLNVERQRQVMRTVRDRLLTPRGLRTLPAEDANYHGRYEGGMFERDRAYHQGTVWAWLIGPYVEGWLRAHGFSAAARQHGRQALEGLVGELDRHSLGQLHEIYGGDPPHEPDGCPAQAWSVAETLRAWLLVGEGAGGRSPAGRG